MDTNAALYQRLRRAIGGSREQTHFEYTFGKTLEEINHITPPAAHQRRILAELEYALALSDANGNRFDEPVRAALTLLLDRISQSGAVTRNDAEEAEALLSPLSDAAKSYDIILCAHAHIDMNWMWSWQETVTSTLETFRTMLAIMREYPDFTFSQSQAAVYKIVEDYEPSMMPEIRQRIEEGRWEVTAAAWVETDKNMPSTESLARHMLYSKQYMNRVWGVPTEKIEVDFSPDTFGHSAHLPELDQQGGVKYYYHCRGNNVTDPLYRWRAPGGKEILVYREPYWYNSSITPHIGSGIIELSRRSAGLKTGLIVYGVGDHGGGPTRRDIERALEMQSWPIYPRLRFGTFHEFFHIAESVRERLPVLEQEMNYIFTGCYTTQSRIKLGNRKSETALYQAEAFSALAGVPGATERYTGAWRNVLFTHFHDILTGSCVQDSREHAMGLYSHALAVANTEQLAALRKISEQIDTAHLATDEMIELSQSEGAGVAYGVESFALPSAERGAGLRRVYHAFNPSPRARKSIVELTVWDWMGDLTRLAAFRADGAPLRVQRLQNEHEKYWDHWFFKALVEIELPANGYATFYLDEAALERYPLYLHPTVRTHAPESNYVLENERIRAEFSFITGEMVSLRADGQELLRAGETAALQYVECDGNQDSAWTIGRYLHKEKLGDRAVIARLPCGGELRNGITIDLPVKNSSAKLTITLDAGSPHLNIDLQIDWHETSKKTYPVPTLLYSVPAGYAASGYRFDVPAGAIERPAQHLDVPGLTYGAALNPSGLSLALASDSKYGYRGADDNLSVTLIHSACSPDPYPERGIHNIKLRLIALEGGAAAFHNAAFDALNVPAYLSSRPHAGTLPSEQSLFALDCGTTAVLSAIKPAEDGNGVVVRLYETEGARTEALLTFASPVQCAQRVDLLEHSIAGCEDTLSVDGATVRLRLCANEVCSVRVQL